MGYGHPHFFDQKTQRRISVQLKRYGSPFLDQGKEVIALGVSFSSTEKAVAEWEAAPYLSLLVER